MKHELNLKWLENMAFESNIDDHIITLDASEEAGGENRGPRPKKMMLLALAGCTGMDVVSILKKMRVDIKDLNVKVEGELTDEHPMYYKHMKIIYEFTGNDLPFDKLEKAVNLSSEKYCGVQALYKLAIPVETEIIIYNKKNL